MGRCPYCGRSTLIGCTRVNGYCLIWPWRLTHERDKQTPEQRMRLYLGQMQRL